MAKKKKKKQKKKKEEFKPASDKIEKSKGGKMLTFFAIATSLHGTTPAMIKAETLKQAHWIYTHRVVVSGQPKHKKRKSHLWKNSGVQKGGKIYWDGEVYVERMKVWKMVKKKYPLAVIAMEVDIKFKTVGDPNEWDD